MSLGDGVSPAPANASNDLDLKRSPDRDGDRLVGGDRLIAMPGNPTAVGEFGAVVSYSADVRTGVSSKLDRGLRLCSKLCRERGRTGPCKVSTPISDCGRRMGFELSFA
jgi:hypothetical protein